MNDEPKPSPEMEYLMYLRENPEASQTCQHEPTYAYCYDQNGDQDTCVECSKCGIRL